MILREIEWKSFCLFTKSVVCALYICLGIRKSGWVNLRRDLVWQHFPQFFLILVTHMAGQSILNFYFTVCFYWSLIFQQSVVVLWNWNCTLERLTSAFDHYVHLLIADILTIERPHFFSCTTTNGFQCLPSFISFHFHLSFLYYFSEIWKRIINILHFPRHFLTTCHCLYF